MELGKTTFARCICGLEKKAAGTLNYNGQIYSVKQRLRLCYLVMQDVNHQLFTESVIDEVLLGINNLPAEEKTSMAEEILTVLDLIDYRDAHPCRFPAAAAKSRPIAKCYCLKQRNNS